MKLRCEVRRCTWHGLDSEVLTAPDPFDAGEQLTGCPKCKSVNTLREVCDEPDCWEFSSCGTPTAKGYRRTCHKHLPKEGLK